MSSTSVFLDPSGRRWKVLRNASIILAVIVIAASAVILPSAFADPYQRNSLPFLTTEQIGNDLPIVGQGPLIRVLKVEGDKGLDPFNNEQVTTLSLSETEQAQSSAYVIQKYGYAPGMSRTISLSFDDGPDPIYTPRMLDVLSANQIPATFFLVGENAAKYPEITQRMAREGHDVGNHTLTHADITKSTPLTVYNEYVLTDRIFRAEIGKSVRYARLPYESDDPESMQENLNGLLATQRLGYIIASHDFDTLDWLVESQPGTTVDDIEMPDFNGQNLTLLLHDAGGHDRTMTVQYVEKIAKEARAAGYTFVPMSAQQPDMAAATTAVNPSIGDKAVFYGSQVFYSATDYIAKVLFGLALLTVVGVGVLNVMLTLLRKFSLRNRVLGDATVPATVLLAAYNEEAVIERTIRSILTSTAPLAEILVVNDGSKDATAEIVQRLSQETHGLVRLINQDNAGKSAALNNGFAQAISPFVVTLDADTLITPSTVNNLVRHLQADQSGRLAAVAGVIRVGNRRRNIITRWQALEYVSQIGVERSAQDYLGAIAIVPGACAAWRASAVLEVGGYSHSTLAEDNDICLTMHKAGYKVTQDDDAAAYTEAPETVDALLAQRTRWTFGTLQTIFKHRDMILRPKYKFLGLLVIPTYVLSTVTPIIFLPLVIFLLWSSYSSGGLGALLPYLLAFAIAHAIVAAVAVICLGERKSLLYILPIYRIVFEPLRAYLLYTSFYLAVRGVKLGWNKLKRTAHLDAASESKVDIASSHTASHLQSIPVAKATTVVLNADSTVPKPSESLNTSPSVSNSPDSTRR